MDKYITKDICNIIDEYCLPKNEMDEVIEEIEMYIDVAEDHGLNAYIFKYREESFINDFRKIMTRIYKWGIL